MFTFRHSVLLNCLPHFSTKNQLLEKVKVQFEKIKKTPRICSKYGIKKYSSMLFTKGFLITSVLGCVSLYAQPFISERTTNEGNLQDLKEQPTSSSTATAIKNFLLLKESQNIETKKATPKQSPPPTAPLPNQNKKINLDKKSIKHRVKRGETLIGISIHYKIPLKNILRKHPSHPLHTGEIVLLPKDYIQKTQTQKKYSPENASSRTTSTQQKTNDENGFITILKSLSKKLLPKKKQEFKTNNQSKVNMGEKRSELAKSTTAPSYKETLKTAKKTAEALNLKFSLPIALQVTRKFSLQGKVSHPNVHFYSQKKLPIHISAAAKIIFNDSLRGLGKTVVLVHNGGFVSIISGLQSVALKTGNTVPAGTILGHSSGSLSYSLAYQGMPVNPIHF